MSETMVESREEVVARSIEDADNTSNTMNTRDINKPQFEYEPAVSLSTQQFLESLANKLDINLKPESDEGQGEGDTEDSKGTLSNLEISADALTTGAFTKVLSQLGQREIEDGSGDSSSANKQAQFSIQDAIKLAYGLLQDLNNPEHTETESDSASEVDNTKQLNERAVKASLLAVVIKKLGEEVVTTKLDVDKLKNKQIKLEPNDFKDILDIDVENSETVIEPNQILQKSHDVIQNVKQELVKELHIGGLTQEEQAKTLEQQVEKALEQSGHRKEEPEKIETLEQAEKAVDDLQNLLKEKGSVSAEAIGTINSAYKVLQKEITEDNKPKTFWGRVKQAGSNLFWGVTEVISGEKFSGKAKLAYSVLKLGVVGALGFFASPLAVPFTIGTLAVLGAGVAHRKYRRSREELLKMAPEKLKGKITEATELNWKHFLGSIVIGGLTGGAIAATGGLAGLGFALAGFGVHRLYTKFAIEKPMQKSLEIVRNELTQSIESYEETHKNNMLSALNVDGVFFKKVKKADGTEVYKIESAATIPALKSVISVLKTLPDDIKNKEIIIGQGDSATQIKIGALLDQLLAKLENGDTSVLAQEIEALLQAVNATYEIAFGDDKDKSQLGLNVLDSLHVLISSAQYIGIVEALEKDDKSTKLLNSVIITGSEVDQKNMQDLADKLVKTFGLTQEQAESLIGDKQDNDKYAKLHLYDVVKFLTQNWENVNSENFADFIDLLYRLESVTVLAKKNVAEQVNKLQNTKVKGKGKKRKEAKQVQEQKAKELENAMQLIHTLFMFTGVHGKYSAEVINNLDTLRQYAHIKELNEKLDIVISNAVHTLDSVFLASSAGARLGVAGGEWLHEHYGATDTSNVTGNTAHDNINNELHKDAGHQDIMQHTYDKASSSYSVPLDKYLTEHGVNHDVVQEFDKLLPGDTHTAFVNDQGHLIVTWDDHGTVHAKDFGPAKDAITELKHAIYNVQVNVEDVADHATEHANNTEVHGIVDLNKIHSMLKDQKLDVSPYGDARNITYASLNYHQPALHQFMAGHVNELSDDQHSALLNALAKGWGDNDDRALSVLAMKMQTVLESHGGHMDVNELAKELYNSSPAIQQSFENQFGDNGLNEFTKTVAELVNAQVQDHASHAAAEVAQTITQQEVSKQALEHLISNASDYNFSDVASDVAKDTVNEVVNTVTTETGSQVDKSLFTDVLDFLQNNKYEIASGVLGALVGGGAAYMATKFEQAIDRGNTKEAKGIVRADLSNVTKIEGLNLTDDEKKLLPEVMNILGREFVWHKLPSGAELGVAKKWGEFAIGGRKIEAFVAVVKQKQTSTASGTSVSDDAGETSSDATEVQKEKLTPVLIVRENGQVRVLPMKEGLDDANELLGYIKDGQGLELSGEFLNLYEDGQKINAFLSAVANKKTRFDLTNQDIAGNFIPEVIDSMLQKQAGKLDKLKFWNKNKQEEDKNPAIKAVLTKIFLNADTKEIVESWKMEWDAEEALAKIRNFVLERGVVDEFRFRYIKDGSDIIGAYRIFNNTHKDRLPAVLGNLMDDGYKVGYIVVKSEQDNQMVEGVGAYFVRTDNGIIVISAFPVEWKNSEDEDGVFLEEQNIHVMANKHSPFREVFGLGESLLTEAVDINLADQLQELLGKQLDESELTNWFVKLNALDAHIFKHISAEKPDDVKIRDNRIIIFGEENREPASGENPENPSSDDDDESHGASSATSASGSGDNDGEEEPSASSENPRASSATGVENLGDDTSEIQTLQDFLAELGEELLNSLPDKLREFLEELFKDREVKKDLNENEKENIVNLFIFLIDHAAKQREDKESVEPIEELSDAEKYIKRHGGSCSKNKPLGCWQKWLEMGIMGSLYKVELVSGELDDKGLTITLNKDKSTQELVAGLYFAYKEYVKASDSHHNNVFSQAVFVNIISKLLKDGEYTITGIRRFIKRDDGKIDVTRMYETYLANLKQYFIDSFTKAGFKEDSVKKLLEQKINDKDLIYTSGGIILKLPEDSQISYQKAGNDNPISIPIESVEYFVDKKPKRQVKRVVRIRIPEEKIDSVVDQLLGIFTMPSEQLDAFKNALQKTRIIRIERRKEASWSLRIEGSDFDVGFKG